MVDIYNFLSTCECNKLIANTVNQARRRLFYRLNIHSEALVTQMMCVHC